MATKQQPISPEFWVHPGETIAEMLEDRGMTQKELAQRTGFSEKHISTVLSGKKSISAILAIRLEYAFDVPASFFNNLQANYDVEVAQWNETHTIKAEEIAIAKEITNSVETLLNVTLDHGNHYQNSVPLLRKYLGISDLTMIQKLNFGNYRGQFVGNTSFNMMYVWQYLCEKETEGQTTVPFNKEKLKESLPAIKQVMFEDFSTHFLRIQEILNTCGVLFTVKPHMRQAPIKGLTVKTKKNQMLIALTIYGKYVDIFWFTLFHEIAHLLNDDYLKKQDDAELVQKAEEEANLFAANQLIDPTLYQAFIEKGDFSEKALVAFAAEAHVLLTIVIGRLNHDNQSWNNRIELRQKYL